MGATPPPPRAVQGPQDTGTMPGRVGKAEDLGTPPHPRPGPVPSGELGEGVPGPADKKLPPRPRGLWTGRLVSDQRTRRPAEGLALGSHQALRQGAGAAPGQQEDGKVFCQSRPEGTRALQSAEGRRDHRRATDGCGSGCHLRRGLSQAPAYPAGSPVGQGEEHELGRSPSSASQLGDLRQASYPVHASASPSVKWDG